MALPSAVGKPGPLRPLRIQLGVRGSLIAAFAVIGGMAVVISISASMLLGQLGEMMVDLSGQDIPRLAANGGWSKQSCSRMVFEDFAIADVPRSVSVAPKCSAKRSAPVQADRVGDGLEIGSAGKGNRHDPRAADTRGGFLFGAVLVNPAGLASANFSGSFDLNQRDLPCVTTFCGVPGG